MKKATWILTLLLVSLIGTDSSARREVLSQEQKELLKKVQRVLVETVAITDAGTIDPAPLAEVVTRRLGGLGYTVLTDPAQPHDVVFRVKCEERKVWEGTSASGGDADLPDSPSRVWKGPACQLTYLLDGKKMGWHKEVRTDFQDAIQAAAQAKAGDPGIYAMAKLKERLEQYYFPALVTADWGQQDRLLKVLDDPTTAPARKAKIISQLGEIFAAEAAPRLVVLLKDPDIPALLDALKTGKPDLKPPRQKDSAS
ncbi:MAG: hypothetical protein AUH74_03790 [Nitrospirae bacterium 13_1_40CM_4_62_6]|nr:MAG: hypothetical protein AUH74_03790 [Nitrospirae bacterium 13_1_40CM_4_62_6]